ncbi:hypothetical protein JX265_003134 [Neoarthrinium moseri]|uniref:Uncharacterized protein n=1 Tax=Neoarthrinium moseri TaxID=1658444 RepID=A0A9P9WTB5_9PEZI|nr:hypothetical protein JX265_003134 [Neoarthrinium moseri]
MTIAHENLVQHYDRATAMAIAAQVREGCISAAVIVRNAFQQITTAEINDVVNNGCHQIASAVIAATSAVPEKSMIGVATGTANCITRFVHGHAAQTRRLPMPHAAATQLAYTAQGVAATIVVRILAGNLVLSEIRAPSRDQSLPGPEPVGSPHAGLSPC